MGGGFEDLKGRLLDAMDAFRDRAGGVGSRVRGLGRRRPNLDGVRDRLAEHGGWLGAAGERMRPWHAIPGVVAALALIVGGFWLGGSVGGHAQAAALTSTVKLKGKVITIDGSRFISTPAVTMKVKGKTVRIPAHTVRLPGSTVVKGKTVAVDVNRTVKVPVTISSTATQTQTNTTTVNNTVTTVTTVVQTVTGPTTTVFGPPVTITVPGPTVTVTVTGP
jgi:hypothetical protein